MKSFLLILLVLVVLQGCGSDTASHDEPHAHDMEHSVHLTAAQYKTAGIQLGGLERRNLGSTLQVSGKIDTPPYNLVSITAIMGGFLRATQIIEGTRVKKGQVLATLENPEFIQMQQDFLDISSQLDYAALELERQESLQKEQISALKTFQRARSEVGSLQAKRAGLEQRLAAIGLSEAQVKKGITRFVTLTSPINGTVTTVNVNLGKYVNPVDVLFEIVDDSHLHVELSVFESDLPAVRPGQHVRFYLSNDPTREMLAEVHLINARIDEDRTVRVHCHLQEKYSGLLPENYVRAVIETGRDTVAALPEQAVVTFDGKTYIFVYKGQEKDEDHGPAEEHFEMVEIKAGITENGFTQVEGDDFLTSDQFAITGTHTLLALLKNKEGDGHAH